MSLRSWYTAQLGEGLVSAGEQRWRLNGGGASWADFTKISGLCHIRKEMRERGLRGRRCRGGRSWGMEGSEVSQETHFRVLNRSGQQGGEAGQWDPWGGRSQSWAKGQTRSPSHTDGWRQCRRPLESFWNLAAWLRSSFLIHLKFKSAIPFSHRKTFQYVWSTLNKYIYFFNLQILWNLNINRIFSMKTSEMRYTVSVKIYTRFQWCGKKK